MVLVQPSMGPTTCCVGILFTTVCYFQHRKQMLLNDPLQSPSKVLRTGLRKLQCRAYLVSDFQFYTQSIVNGTLFQALQLGLCCQFSFITRWNLALFCFNRVSAVGDIGGFVHKSLTTPTTAFTGTTWSTNSDVYVETLLLHSPRLIHVPLMQRLCW